VKSPGEQVGGGAAQCKQITARLSQQRVRLIVRKEPRLRKVNKNGKLANVGSS